MRNAAIVLGTLLLACVFPAAGDDLRGPVAITNVTVIPQPGQRIANGTIVIRDGRIEAVGANVTIPAGARVVDGRGGFAYAGFVDGFSRVGVSKPEHDGDDERRIESDIPSISEGPHADMQQANRHGIFARRRVEDLLDIKDDTFAKHREGGFTVALLAPPRGLLGGSASVIELGSGALRSSVLSAETLQTGSFSPPRGRSLRTRGNYPGTLLGSIAHVRQTLLDAGWYGQMLAYADATTGVDVPYDPDLSRLLAMQQGKMGLAWEASGEDQIRRSLAVLGEFDLSPVIVGGTRAWEAADALKQRESSVLISLDLPKEPRDYKFNAGKLSADVKDGTTLGGSWGKRPFQPKAAFEEARRERDAILSNPQRLNEAGVLWAFTTNGGRNVKDNLATVRHFIDAGLSADDALRGLTTSAADILGVRDQLGTLEAGKRGNVTLLSKPLGDKDTHVTHVVVGGDLFVIDDSEKEADDKKKDKKGDDKKDGDKKGDKSKTDEAKEADESDEESDPLRAHEPGWAIETDAERGANVGLGGNVLLENAHVLTITDGDLENTSILVKDGKIARIGRNLQAGPGVKRIDLKGYVVMPGMIDPHAHTSVAAINEWTMSVTPEVRISDVITHDDPVMYWALTGGLTTMHTMHGSANAIGGQNMILKNRYGKSIEHLPYDAAKRTVKFALGENVKRQGLASGRFDSNSARRFPGTRMGVEATMRRALAAGDAYRKARAEHAAATRSGRKVAPFRRDLRLEALADVLDGNLWVNCHCYRSDEILRLLKIAEDFGFRIAALHHVLEGYRVMPEIMRHGCGTATFADWWAYKIEAYDAVPHNAGMMLKHGINSTVKSDSDDLIRHMNVEAAKCMKFSNLSPNDALRMVTINAAKLFGMDDRIGSIEVGKDADLAIFSGHPLDTFSRCVMTLIDGEAYFVHHGFDPEKPGPARPIKTFADTSQPRAKKPGTVNTRSDKPMAPQRGTFAITNAKLHPVSSPSIQGGTLVIRDGRIAAIGKDVAVPSDAKVIDARGQHVYPGLINAGTNLGLYEIGAVNVTVDTSGPGTHQADLMAVSALNPHSVMFEVARAEGITTALVVANGPTIAGQAGTIHLDGWSMPEMLVDGKFGLVVNLPSGRSEPIVPRNRERGGDEDAADPLAEIDRFFKDARLYNAAPDDFAYDARYAAMEPYLDGSKPVLLRANSYRQILEALQFAARHGLKPILFGARDAWRVADLLAERNVPVIYEGTFAMPTRVPGLGNVTDAWDAHYRGLAVLAEAGVKFGVSRRDADLAKLAATEIGFAVAHGLDPERAVRALTLDAAEILGMGDQIGSLETGKLANVIVCSDHPAQVTNRIEHVFIRGALVPTASKHSRMADKFAGRPSPELPDRRNDLAGPPNQSTR